MTKQEITARLEQIRVDLAKRDTEVSNQLITMFETMIPFKVSCFVSITQWGDLYAKIELVNDKSERIFGTDFTINFGRKKIMEINYGSIGNHTSKDANGAYKYSDILVGKAWENEDKITQIYQNIDLTKDIEYSELYSKLRDIEWEEKEIERKEQQRLEDIENDKIINRVKEKMLVYTKAWNDGYVKAKIAKITANLVYMESRYPTGKLRFKKEEFLKKIKKGTLIVDLPEGEVTD